MFMHLVDAVQTYAKRSPGRRLVVDAITVVVIAAISFFVWRGTTRDVHDTRAGKEAHDYLCYQKTVVIPRRINDTRQYLQDIHTGKRSPIPGFTDEDFAISMRRDMDALRALSRVSC